MFCATSLILVSTWIRFNGLRHFLWPYMLQGHNTYGMSHVHDV